MVVTGGGGVERRMQFKKKVATDQEILRWWSMKQQIWTAGEELQRKF